MVEEVMEAIIIRSFTIRNPPMARILALDFLARPKPASRVGWLVRERVRMIGGIAC
ncbi:MAG: hypothetical protein IIC78_05145 [Chloroflexi bacterium]|nr:hypothetical protein [Chloroflexota bacterium]